MWVRNLSYFTKGFILSVILMMLAVAMTSFFALKQIKEQDGHGIDYQPINRDSYWDMVGYAFYMFEGIGALLPVMREV